MSFEVEQKFRVQRHEALEERLAALGIQWRAEESQVDSYFAHPARDFARTDEALRLRRAGAGNFITYKGPKLDATTKTRREIELPIASGEGAAEKFAELLAALGFRRVAEVHKRRRAGGLRWEGQDLEIALDRVAELGTFVELEAAADAESLAAARQRVASLASHLGLTDNERRSYLELLLESKQPKGARP